MIKKAKETKKRKEVEMVRIGSLRVGNALTSLIEFIELCEEEDKAKEESKK